MALKTEGLKPSTVPFESEVFQKRLEQVPKRKGVTLRKRQYELYQDHLENKSLHISRQNVPTSAKKVIKDNAKITFGLLEKIDDSLIKKDDDTHLEDSLNSNLQRSDSAISSDDFGMKEDKKSNVVSKLMNNIAENDIRFPVFLGNWLRSIPYKDDQVALDNLDEPHIKRKRTILNKYPEITELYGPDYSTKFITFSLMCTQLYFAYLFGHQWSGHPFLMIGFVYIFGAVATQTFGVVIHEASHGLCGDSISINRLTGFMANVCIPFPIYSSFRRYHLEHHAFQGVATKDPDLPLEWETRLIKGNPIAKIIFLFLYPCMYVVRGLAQQKPPGRWEIYNLLFTICTDILIYNICGLGGFMYLFCCLWFGYGLHPAAGHFIQEHFTFDEGQETYSYYGIMNLPMLNIGLHNEHHDFTRIAWSKLPLVTRIAPEFYLSMSFHTSWFWTLVNFIVYPDIGPQSRVIRSYEDHRRGRSMIKAN